MTNKEAWDAILLRHCGESRAESRRPIVHGSEVAMIDLSVIPEKDRVCVYCKHFGSQDRGDDNKKCMGTLPCLNYHKDNVENFFVPDDWYLQNYFGCRACKHYDDYYDGVGECESCERRFDDNWTRNETLV